MEQVCTKCAKSKPITSFPKDKTYKNGRKKRCHNCIHLQTKARFKAQGRGWYQYVKARRERVKLKFGFGGGLLWRYGLKVLVPLFAKYDGKCSVCKTTENLSIHHLDGRGRHYWERTRNRMNNDINNLILLCRKCHGRIDGLKQSTNKVR